jgi:hypothetical protein
MKLLRLPRFNKRGETMLYKTIAIFITAAWVVGCTPSDQPTVEEESDSPTIEQVEQEVKEAVETAAEYVSSEKDQFEVRIEKEITELDDKITALRSEIAETSAESQAAFDDALAAIDERRQDVSDELDQLKSASGEAWADVRGGVKNAVQELQRAYETARSRFDDNDEEQPAEAEEAAPADSEQ